MNLCHMAFFSSFLPLLFFFPLSLALFFQLTTRQWHQQKCCCHPVIAIASPSSKLGCLTNVYNKKGEATWVPFVVVIIAIMWQHLWQWRKKGIGRNNLLAIIVILHNHLQHVSLQPPCHRCHFTQSSSTCKFTGATTRKKVRIFKKKKKKNKYKKRKKKVGRWEALWIPSSLPTPLKFI